MKKILLILLLCPLFLVSCGDDNEEDYTSEQKKALSILNGTWVWDKGGNLQETIIFHGSYNEIKEFYEKDPIKGDVYNFSAMGECTYEIKYYEDSRNYKCYYNLSNDLLTLRLYGKESESSLESFSISFESDTQIRLIHKDPNHLGVSMKVFTKE